MHAQCIFKSRRKEIDHALQVTKIEEKLKEDVCEIFYKESFCTGIFNILKRLYVKLETVKARIVLCTKKLNSATFSIQLMIFSPNFASES